MGKKGQLLFKGDKRPKKKSKKSKADKKDRDDETRIVQQDIPKQEATAAAAVGTNPKPTIKSTTMPSIQSGTGKITTSGTVVTGHGTKFQSELGVGDAILVGDEMRVITMRLSDTSLNLSSAFSTSLKEPTKFRFVAKPKNKQQEAQAARQKQHQEASAVQRNAFDIYGKNSSSSNNSSSSSNVFTYREKTETGSYRVKQQATSSTSRTDLLALRSKKTSDKYC